MSGVAGLFGAGAPDTSDDVVGRMSARLAQRGAQVRAWRRGTAVLAVARAPWELEAGFSGPVHISTAGPLAVAADASLYYRDDLRRALAGAGHRAADDSPSALILAAYRAWGERCADALEGDFAFVLWDAERERVVCARDFTGRRPLFYALVGGTLLVGSVPSALRAHPLCPDELDPLAIAADAAGLFAVESATAYRGIWRLGAGESLVWRVRSRSVTRHRRPLERSATPVGFDEAAEELAALLRDAVIQRLAPEGPTSVWLSGGWDSSAVFGTAASVAGEDVSPVSLSFPAGDPGHEDGLIAMIAGRWDRPIHWLNSREIPLLDDARGRALEREEPFAHAFEMGNRALAAGSRAVGARVALDGVGGDQLFQVSPVYFADLLQRGRWVAAAREWQRSSLGGTGARSFARWAVLPLVSPTLLGSLASLAGRPTPCSHFERRLPPWIRNDFARRTGLLAREREHAPAPRIGRSRVDHEMSWYLTYPYFPRVFACVGEFALDAGVELRSPLYDRRIVEFAAARPRRERSDGRETKRLLRHAMRRLLPPEVLAPRASRTGTTEGYFGREMRQSFSRFWSEVIAGPLQLAALGIADPPALRAAWDRYAAGGNGALGVSLFMTLQTELWLRARTCDAAAEYEAAAFGGCQNRGHGARTTALAGGTDG